MKKLLFIFVLLPGLYAFLFSNALAAIETRTYLLTFENSPNAGPANNVRFFINLHPSLLPIQTKINILFENGDIIISGPEEIFPGEYWQETIKLSGPSEILNQLDDSERPLRWEDANFAGTGKTIFRRVVNENILDALRLNQEVVQQVKKVAVPLAIGLGGIGIISLGTTAVTVSANLAFNLAEFFRYVAFGFLRFKKRKPWGTVYNQITNQPMPGVLVKIFDAKTKKHKESQLTDKEGRFGFLITPGEYYIKVARRGFQEQQTENLKIARPEAVVDLNIYLVSTAIAVKKTFGISKVLNAIRVVLDYINPYVLTLGTLLSLLVVLIIPTTFNSVIFGAYIVLDILKILLSRRTIKSFGVVKDNHTSRALDLAVIRIFNADKNWLLNTKVTDESGRFNFLTTAGSYYVTAARSGYQPFHSNLVHVKKAGIINFDIKLSGE